MQYNNFTTILQQLRPKVTEALCSMNEGVVSPLKRAGMKHTSSRLISMANCSGVVITLDSHWLNWLSVRCWPIALQPQQGAFNWTRPTHHQRRRTAEYTSNINTWELLLYNVFKGCYNLDFIYWIINIDVVTWAYLDEIELNRYLSVNIRVGIANALI